MLTVTSHKTFIILSQMDVIFSNTYISIRGCLASIQFTLNPRETLLTTCKSYRTIQGNVGKIRQERSRPPTIRKSHMTWEEINGMSASWFLVDSMGFARVSCSRIARTLRALPGHLRSYSQEESCFKQRTDIIPGTYVTKGCACSHSRGETCPFLMHLDQSWDGL